MRFYADLLCPNRQVLLHNTNSVRKTPERACFLLFCVVGLGGPGRDNSLWARPIFFAVIANELTDLIELSRIC